MADKKKESKIELKDITSSPYFMIGVMVLICALVIGAIVFLVLNINKTKKEIIDARELYVQNVKEVAILEELKVQSEAAEEKLAACENILPKQLGDVYVLEEKVLETCKDFGLDINSCEFTVAKNETNEVVFNLQVTGSLTQIHDYMKYYSTLEQVHRFDSITLFRDTAELYSATFALAILSEDPAEGAIVAVVDEAVDSVTETTEAAK